MEPETILLLILIICYNILLLYYVYKLENGECKCIQNWHHHCLKYTIFITLVFIILIIIITWLDSTNKGKNIYLFLYLILVIILILRSYCSFVYIHNLNKTNCNCLSKMPKINTFLYWIRWYDILFNIILFMIIIAINYYVFFIK